MFPRQLDTATRKDDVMDPDANLQEQIELATAILFGGLDPEPGQAAGYRLAELVLSLDEWLTHQGFPPERWMR